ncbi:hypothetical protein [Pseudovibrio sp. W64]|uniref:hypothetical protein n=1 Tax=Pseudovibrio sp. W64 TaxID=1735583 RepID=UPI0007AEA069|nr:hypothetical protein [Pseudovibrio sp. W64]
MKYRVLKTLFALASFVSGVVAWFMTQGYSYLANDVFWGHVGLTAACCFFFLITASIVIASSINQSGNLKAPHSLNDLFLLILLILQGGAALGTIFNFEASLQIAQASAQLKGVVVSVQNKGSAVLYGEIGSKTFDTLKMAHSKAPIHSIELRSGGGDITSAERIGAFINDKGIEVLVKSHCASACVLIALSASELYVSPDARFGFHQASTAASLDSQMGSFYGKIATEEFISQLKILGTPSFLLEQVRKTPPNQMYYISGEDLSQFGLAEIISVSHQ